MVGGAEGSPDPIPLPQVCFDLHCILDFIYGSQGVMAIKT